MEPVKAHAHGECIKTPKNPELFDHLFRKISEVFYDCEVLSFGIIDTEDHEIAVNLCIPETEHLMTVFLTKEGVVHGSREGYPSNSTSHLFFRGVLSRCENNKEVQEFCAEVIGQSFVLYENFEIPF